jgi:hypothetical protein
MKKLRSRGDPHGGGDADQRLERLRRDAVALEVDRTISSQHIHPTREQPTERPTVSAVRPPMCRVRAPTDAIADAHGPLSNPVSAATSTFIVPRSPPGASSASVCG